MKNKLQKNLIKVFFLPPPNITGQLHIGHTVNYILTDILLRKNKMMGYKALWFPGFDHAGIATQLVIEKYLEKYGLNKNKIKRNFFIKFILKWKKKYKLLIIKQIKKFNILINWKLKYFTKNYIISKLVKKIFISLYKKNIIYKKFSIINWDPLLLTPLSDLEIKKIYKNLYMYNILYPFINKKGFLYILSNINNFKKNIFIIINKINNIFFYKKKLFLPLTNKKIILIIKKFYKKYYNAIIINLINCNDYIIRLIKNFKLILNKFFYKNYLKLKNNQNNLIIKKFILLKLKTINLIKNIKKHKIIAYKSEKTNSEIKIKIKNQWFINMNKKINIYKNKKKFTLSNIIIFLIKKKKIKFIPINWLKIYYKWLKNINDWCISRKLWWGHKIPIFYFKRNIFIINNFKKKKIYFNFKNKLKKDKNVLDTWFSSALIPIISIKILNKKFNFKNFIKSEILITGYDIIFFWIIRMIIFSLYFVKFLPFKKIYTHGLIKDKNGNKMSKSKGNTINPLKLIKKKLNIKFKNNNNTNIYNIDVLRLTFLSIINLNKDIKFNFEKFNNYNYIYKKIINITVFIIKYCKIYKNFTLINDINKNLLINNLIEKWFLSILEEYKIFLYKNFKNLKINLIAQKTYIFIWNIFSKWFLEFCKIDIIYKSINKKYLICKNLLYNYYNLIKLLHPLIPTLTQKIFNKIYNLLIKFNIINNKFKFLILMIYPKINFLKINFRVKNFINKKIIKIIKNIRKINNKINNIIILFNNYKIYNIIKLIKKTTKIKIINIITNKIYIKQNI